MTDGPDLANCSASEPFALRVIGDDMAPEFEDGHLIIVDPGGRVVSGCYVVARQQSGMILRQLIGAGDCWQLHALDPSIDDIPLDNGLADIVGVISQRAGSRRKQHKRYDV
jgi:SOS-response transcriptional repressor LexA